MKRWIMKPHMPRWRIGEYFPGWQFHRITGRYIIGGYSDVLSQAAPGESPVTARETALFILLTKGREFGKAP